MSETLPERPHLDWYKKAAKKKLLALHADDPAATLADAQLAIARERGFASWRKLRQAVESLLQSFHTAVEAVQKDRPSDLARILKQHPTIISQQTPSSGYSLLHYVASRLNNEIKPRRLESLRILLEAGHPIDTALPNKDNGEGGETALHFAATLEDVPVTDALINAGASVHLSGSGDGGTPLVQGMFYGALGACERLATVAVAPVNLRVAAGLGGIDLIDQLCPAGKPSSEAGSHRAFYRPHDEYPAWTLLNDPQEWLDEALIYATKCNRLAAVARLLEIGANVNGMPYDATALHFAAWFGRREILELLLQQGADLTLHDRQYNGIAEGWAHHGGHPELADLLRQAKPTAPADDTAKQLLALVAAGDVDGVRAVLDVTPALANAIGPHPSWGGRPQPLHVAIERNHRDMFDLLLERGADPKGDNAAYEHWSPAMIARHWRRTEMLAELRKRLGPDELFLALMDGNDDRAMELLTDPVALDRRMPNDATPLHFATTVRPAQRLLELGVPLDAKDKYGKTPIILAAENNRPELVKLLIDRGAEGTPEIFAKLGDLPRLKKAVRGKPAGEVMLAAVEAQQIETVRWLIDRGADANTRSAKGSKGTPLHSAAWNGHLELAELLVAAGADTYAIDEEHKTTPLVWAQTARKFTGNTNCDAVVAYLETVMSATDPNVEAFLNAAVPTRTEDHRSGNHKAAAAILKKHPAIADANIYTAAVLGRAATIAKLLKNDPKLATKPGGPRNWQPASYLAFSRFLKHEPKRQADFLKSMKLFLNAGVDVNTSWLEKPDDPKSQKESLLYGAAGVANNTALTKLLLKSGADPNDGESLYHACEFKNNDILKLLYDAGVTPESWSYCLLRKLDYEDFEGVKFMLGRGINPNHLHPGTGKAAMHWAIMRRRGLRFIKAIHAAGGDPNLADKEGFTPYTLATRLGRSDVAEYLLKHGAIDDRDAAAKLIDAAVAGDMKTVRAMLKQSPKIVKSLTPAQLQALPGAAAAGNLAGVKALLDLGWPIDTQGDWGGSALHHAAWNDHPAVVKLLLKRGARIDVHQQWDGDALHTALHAIQTEPRMRAAEIVGALVKSGQINDVRKYMPEDPDQPGADKVIKLLTPYLPKHSDDPVVKALPAHRKGHKIAQWKPIMDAAYTGDAERIKKLLKEGADPNIVSTTPARYRPLHRAIERKKSFKRGPKDIAAVKALLAGGADPKLLGMWGKHTALGMAASYEPMFVPVLIDYFKPLDIIHAAAVADEERVAELLKKDKKLANARDAGDWTPLHYAAASRMHELGPAWSAKLVNIAKLLLKAGADVMAAWNYNDEWPLRPLYYAAGWSNHPAMAELLLQNGADACDNESTYHAADEGYAGCLAMIEKYTPKAKLAKECTSCLPTQLHWGATRGAKWLLEHGADPNVVSPRYGKSALQIASEGGASGGVISLLLQHGGDPKAKNDKGQSAIDLAKAAGKTRVVDQLKKA